MEQCLTAKIAIVHPGASPLNQSLAFGFQLGQSSLFCSLGISLYALYHLQSSTRALAAMKEHSVGAESVAVRPRSLYTAHETHSVPHIVPREHIESGFCLIPRTASAVRRADKYHARLSGQYAARLEPIQVLELIASCIANEAVPFHSYF